MDPPVTLQVTIVSVSSLVGRNLNGLSNPYVQIFLGNHKEADFSQIAMVGSTTPVWGVLSAEFNQSFEFSNITLPTILTLRVCSKSRDEGSSATSMPRLPPQEDTLCGIVSTEVTVAKGGVQSNILPLTDGGDASLAECAFFGCGFVEFKYEVRSAAGTSLSEPSFTTYKTFSSAAFPTSLFPPPSSSLSLPVEGKTGGVSTELPSSVAASTPPSVQLAPTPAPASVPPSVPLGKQGDPLSTVQMSATTVSKSGRENTGPPPPIVTGVVPFGPGDSRFASFAALGLETVPASTTVLQPTISMPTESAAHTFVVPSPPRAMAVPSPGTTNGVSPSTSVTLGTTSTMVSSTTVPASMYDSAGSGAVPSPSGAWASIPSAVPVLPISSGNPTGDTVLSPLNYAVLAPTVSSPSTSSTSIPSLMKGIPTPPPLSLGVPPSVGPGVPSPVTASPASSAVEVASTSAGASAAPLSPSLHPYDSGSALDSTATTLTPHSVSLYTSPSPSGLPFPNSFLQSSYSVPPPPTAAGAAAPAAEGGEGEVAVFVPSPALPAPIAAGVPAASSSAIPTVVGVTSPLKSLPTTTTLPHDAKTSSSRSHRHHHSRPKIEKKKEEEKTASKRDSTRYASFGTSKESRANATSGREEGEQSQRKEIAYSTTFSGTRHGGAEKRERVGAPRGGSLFSARLIPPAARPTRQGSRRGIHPLSDAHPTTAVAASTLSPPRSDTPVAAAAASLSPSPPPGITNSSFTTTTPEVTSTMTRRSDPHIAPPALTTTRKGVRSAGDPQEGQPNRRRETSGTFGRERIPPSVFYKDSHYLFQLAATGSRLDVFHRLRLIDPQLDGGFCTCVDYAGRTLLHVAAWHGQTELLRILLSPVPLPPLIDLRSLVSRWSQDTIFHSAAKGGQVRSIVWIRNAFPTICAILQQQPNAKGWTPAECALASGFREVAEILV